MNTLPGAAGNGFPWPIVASDSDPTSDSSHAYLFGVKFDKLVELYWRARTLKFDFDGSITNLGPFGQATEALSGSQSGALAKGDDDVEQTQYKAFDPVGRIKSPDALLARTSWSTSFSKQVANQTVGTFTWVGDQIPLDSHTDPATPGGFPGIHWVWDYEDDSGDSPRYIGHWEWPGQSMIGTVTADVSFSMFQGNRPVLSYDGLYYPAVSFSIGVTARVVYQGVDASSMPSSYYQPAYEEYGYEAHYSNIPDPSGTSSTVSATLFGQATDVTVYNEFPEIGTNFDKLTIDINDWWPYRRSDGSAVWDSSSGAYNR